MPNKTKKSSRPQSRVAKNKIGKKVGLKPWMIVAGIVVIVLLGYVIVRFSNAGTIGVNAPVLKHKQQALQSAFNNCVNSDTDSTNRWPIILDTAPTPPREPGYLYNINNGLMTAGYRKGATIEHSGGPINYQWGSGATACYMYARVFLNTVLNDSGMSDYNNDQIVDNNFSYDIRALRVTINKLLDIQVSRATHQGDAEGDAARAALQHFRDLGMIDSNNYITASTSEVGYVDDQLWKWINFFTYIYLTAPPVGN